MGSPIVKFLSTVHGKLKSFAMMNLKILFTFMLWVALEKKRVAFIALAYALACSNNTKSITKQEKNYVFKDLILQASNNVEPFFTATSTR